jgi:thiol-disulfide isomerase/thioredoxin
MRKVLLLFCLAGCASSSSTKPETISIAQYKPGATVTRPTIYMFSTDTCEPCKTAKPIVEQEARLHGDQVVIVAADDDRLVKKMGYSSLPVFRFVKPGAPDLVMKGWDKKRFAKAYQHFDGKYLKR